MNGQITDEVRAFIEAHIHSVEQLEVLLLLRRQPSRLFTGPEVARELRVHPDSAVRRLEDLTSRRLAVREANRYRYEPSDHRLERDVDALAAAYVDARVAVIQHIFSKPLDGPRGVVDSLKSK